MYAINHKELHDMKKSATLKERRPSCSGRVISSRVQLYIYIYRYDRTQADFSGICCLITYRERGER